MHLVEIISMGLFLRLFSFLYTETYRVNILTFILTSDPSWLRTGII
jgi:hypothetical protein